MLQCHASTDRRTGPLFKEPDLVSTSCGIPTESAVPRQLASTMSICNSPAFLPSTAHNTGAKTSPRGAQFEYDGLISVKYLSDSVIAYTLLRKGIAFASAAVLHYAPTRLRDLWAALGLRQGNRVRACLPSPESRTLCESQNGGRGKKKSHPSCGPLDKIKLPVPNQHDVPESS